MAHSDTCVLLDVDGVLANFVGGIIKSLGLSVDPHDCQVSDWHYVLGISDEEFLAPTMESGWWERLEPYPQALQMVRSIRNETSVVFATSPTYGPACASEKVRWLIGHGFLPAQSTDYMIGPHKHLMAGRGYLIDDSDKNVAKFRKYGGNAFLFPQPWNAMKAYSRGQQWEMIPGIVANHFRGNL